MYDKKFEEVLSKSKVSQEELYPMVEKYKFELQGNKSHRLESKGIKISEVFGSLTTLNYDLRINFSNKVNKFSFCLKFE